MLLCGQSKITDKNQINHQLHHFDKTLFTEKLQIKNENVTVYLNQMSIPVLTGEQLLPCESPILENELLSLLKEFYEAFLKELKKYLCASIRKASHKVKFIIRNKQL